MRQGKETSILFMVLTDLLTERFPFLLNAKKNVIKLLFLFYITLFKCNQSKDLT